MYIFATIYVCLNMFIIINFKWFNDKLQTILLYY